MAENGHAAACPPETLEERVQTLHHLRAWHGLQMARVEDLLRDARLAEDEHRAVGELVQQAVDELRVLQEANAEAMKEDDGVPRGRSWRPLVRKTQQVLELTEPPQLGAVFPCEMTAQEVVPGSD